MRLAHQVEWFARQKALKPLDKYLPRRPSKRQTTDEMLAVFRVLAERSPINIKKLN